MAENPTFLCDAMLGGLARWLRAAGYDALFEYGIDDAVLVMRAAKHGYVVLSSDGPLFERRLVRTGKVRALFVPRGLNKMQQLAFVMRQLRLRPLAPRCMACGGELAPVPRHQAAAEAPPVAFRRCRDFWRCTRCGRLLWHGTHWQRISQRLTRVME
jgi:uncharacterized protein with PIN domain